MNPLSSATSPLIETNGLHYYSIPTGRLERTDSNVSSNSGGKCSVGQATSNLVNVLLGAGMFYLPYTCYLMGWSAVLLILLFGCICVYSFSLIAECIEAYIAKHSIYTHQVSFADLGDAAFGITGSRVCMLSLFVEFILAAVSMLINIGVNVNSVNPNIDIVTCILCSSVVTFWLASMNDMKLFSYISSSGNAIISVSFLILLVSGSQFDQVESTTISSPSFHKVLDVQGIPLSLGLIVFCYGGIGAFPKIYMSLENRSQYPKLLYLSGLCILGAYASVAFASYYFYGKYTLMPVTKNIGYGVQRQRIAFGALEEAVAALGIAFNLQVTIPLIFFALRDILYSVTGNKDDHSANSRYAISFCLTFFCVTFSVFFHQHFAALCSLVGSIATTLNSVCLPIAFYYRLCPLRHTLSVRLMHSAILVFVLFSSAMGITSNVCRMFVIKDGVCMYF